jgi:hypothetical protein
MFWLPEANILEVRGKRLDLMKLAKCQFAWSFEKAPGGPARVFFFSIHAFFDWEWPAHP